MTAAGHETDFTICVFVADVRAPTPSAAAELCVPVKNDLLLTLVAQKNRLLFSASHHLKQKKHHLIYLIKSLPTPQMMLDRLILKLSDFENRLHQSLKEKITRLHHEVENYKTSIHLLSPQSVLKRGYLIGKNRAGKIIKRKSEVAAGDDLTLVFFDGEVITKVCTPKGGSL
jgi:exodeoxyribonuclease VII large subunit